MYQHKKLSKNMRSGIRYLMQGNELKNIATKNALAKRGILNSENQLTSYGEILGISLLSLPSQCQYLHIDLEQIELAYTGKPEKALMDIYNNQGFVCVNAEGGAISNIIKAILFDDLYKVLKKYRIFSQDKICSHFLEGMLEIIKSDNIDFDLKRIFENTNRELFIKNFNKILSNKFTKLYYPHLTFEFGKQFIKNVNMDWLYLLANQFQMDPYRFRSGWPDLTLVNGEYIEFVEVKTTDKLHYSQIDTISFMKDLTPYKFKVVRIKKTI